MRDADCAGSNYPFRCGMVTMTSAVYYRGNSSYERCRMRLLSSSHWRGKNGSVIVSALEAA
jgi:hypothetical protein